MKTIDLKDQEEILVIVSEIRKVHGEVESLDEAIRALIERQKKLVEELETRRSVDRAFSEYLIGKYGPGKLDLHNMQWVEKE